MTGTVAFVCYFKTEIKLHLSHPLLYTQVCFPFVGDGTDLVMLPCEGGLPAAAPTFRCF